MNYWMLTVMYDKFPTLWRAMVEQRVAAQHYPRGWTNEIRNLNALRQMKRGDIVIAALKGYRFAGYGILKTDFFRGGTSLEIERKDDTLAFQERAETDWIALPLTTQTPYVICRNLVAEGYDVSLRRGLSIRRTDEPTFTRIREILDRADAEPTHRLSCKPRHRTHARSV